MSVCIKFGIQACDETFYRKFEFFIENFMNFLNFFEFPRSFFEYKQVFCTKDFFSKIRILSFKQHSFAWICCIEPLHGGNGSGRCKHGIRTSHMGHGSRRLDSSRGWWSRSRPGWTSIGSAFQAYFGREYKRNCRRTRETGHSILSRTQRLSQVNRKENPLIKLLVFISILKI